jgi:putative membrane protein
MLTIQSIIKSVVYFALCVVAISGSMGCGDSREANQKDMGLAINKPIDDLTKKSDEQFLISVAEFNFEQILLGKLAQQRSSSTAVRDLAKMLEEDHRETRTALGSMAIIKSISIPGAPTKAANDSYDKINAAPVEAFDAAYLTEVIASHNDAITLFELCLRSNHDADILAWAQGRLPVLRSHLSSAMELDAQLGPLSELIR